MDSIGPTKVLWFNVSSLRSAGTTLDLENETNVTSYIKYGGFDWTQVAWSGGVSGGSQSKEFAMQSHEVYVNGMLQRPEGSGSPGFPDIITAAGAYTPSGGDYVLVNNGTVGIKFAFDLLATDTVKVIYK
jgi:hypothetical protein